MATQARTTLEIADRFQTLGWTVAFTCIPNTPHVGAVPIPTGHGSSQQRYPDIVATIGSTLAVVEVEISLNASIARDILERFREIRIAIERRETYLAWAKAVERRCGVDLPTVPALLECLVTVKPVKHPDSLELLRLYGCHVSSAEDFDPSWLSRNAALPSNEMMGDT